MYNAGVTYLLGRSDVADVVEGLNLEVGVVDGVSEL